jgi:predicted 3-demethylubiquinone-9 3-methyltransferase (glyoxalase superfamily)
MSRIYPFLWYVREAEEAARFYVSVFPNSKIERVTTLQSDTPSGPPGSVKVVDFTLMGQRISAMSAGPRPEFNEAISLLVECADQAEIDRYWNAILDNGGQPQACGWIIDKYGLRWQITASALVDMTADSDQARAQRVTEEFLKQVKVDIARLEAAFEGR